MYAIGFLNTNKSKFNKQIITVESRRSFKKMANMRTKDDLLKQKGY